MFAAGRMDMKLGEEPEGTEPNENDPGEYKVCRIKLLGR